MKMAQHALDREEENREHEGPDQEAPGFYLVDVALPVAVEACSSAAIVVFGILIAGIASGRI